MTAGAAAPRAGGRRYWLWSAVCFGLSVPLAVTMLLNHGGPVPVVRVATFNASLNRPAAGQLLAELRGGGCEQARRIAEIVQRNLVDVLLLCELDRDEAAATADVFAAEYLAVGQGGAAPIEFPFRYAGPVNTGVPSGMDLDGDGATDGPGDAFGYGRHPGQYGMAVFSRHPILSDEIRTFQQLRWSRKPGAMRPEGFWDDATWNRLRLSSKSHWDVPIGLPDRQRLHLLCSHPTPPAFDGPEDRNGRRNHDEIAFWTDYLHPSRSAWITDDAGARGGLPAGADFVLLGDLNCDPVDGEACHGAIARLLAHPGLRDVAPTSAGAVEAATRQWGRNSVHAGPPAQDTADFADDGDGPGNLRVDYVLPSSTLRAVDQGVFWPPSSDPRHGLVEASDHRLVWVDIALPGS